MTLSISSTFSSAILHFTSILFRSQLPCLALWVTQLPGASWHKGRNLVPTRFASSSLLTQPPGSLGVCEGSHCSLVSALFFVVLLRAVPTLMWIDEVMRDQCESVAQSLVPSDGMCSAVGEVRWDGASYHVVSNAGTVP